jgi:hypothetical protein
MTTPDLTDVEIVAILLADLRAATGPSRELDGRIHAQAAFGPLTEDERLEVVRWATSELVCECCDHLQRTVPAYTASLDAALSLVPKGCEIEMLLGYSGPNSSAIIWSPRLHMARIALVGRSDKELALAICTAALKARAHD